MKRSSLIPGAQSVELENKVGNVVGVQSFVSHCTCKSWACTTPTVPDQNKNIPRKIMTENID
jgi:hypothetical protein